MGLAVEDQKVMILESSGLVDRGISFAGAEWHSSHLKLSLLLRQMISIAPILPNPHAMLASEKDIETEW